MRVLQLIDTLDAGGAERMAVNLANALVSKVEKSYLCATREEGILQPTIDNKVVYVFLNKRNTLDITAIRRFYTILKREHIDIVHAHSSSFFLAALVAKLLPKLKVVWHDHYGNSEFLNQRPKCMLRLFSGQFSHSFGVNKELVTWAKKHLQHNSVSYLPNFIDLDTTKERFTVLKGNQGKRIVCLANLRPQKDHINLLWAFSKITKDFPGYSLHCVGQDFENVYSAKLYRLTKDLDLNSKVYFYGTCPDISAILSACDIGVLASRSEGLPLALLEYGRAELPVVVTAVGDCGGVVENEKSGLVVPSEDSEALYNGLYNLIIDHKKSKQFGLKLNQTVVNTYSASAIINSVLKQYKLVVHNSISI
jgi:glycosyltransferase involved in cell wall biosynthesis